MSKVLIEVINLNKTFRVKKLKKIDGKKTHIKQALSNLSLQINEGENIAILGGNGAGKTTLVEIIVGLTKYDSGEIKYLYDYKKSFKEKIGIQFQTSSYPTGISVNDVISFALDVYKIKIDKNELNELLTVFGLNNLLKKGAKSLSGGEQQRLNAVLSVIHKPKIVFLDELSTGLDINIRNAIKNYMKDYSKKNNMSLVVVSHDMNEVQYLCDRVIILRNGVKVVDRSMDDILNETSSLEEYVTNNI